MSGAAARANRHGVHMDSQRNGRGNARLPDEVAPAELGHELQQRFEHMRQVLRVPFVDQIWRVLANFPAYLAPAWDALAPVLRSTAGEHAGDELRRAAVIELAITLPSHKAFRGDMSRAEIASDDRARISNYTAAMQYVLPKLLLAATLLDPDVSHEGGSAAALEPLPLGVAEDAPIVEPMNPAEARGEIPGLFAEIRERHGYPQIADYYRAIARAGDFLRVGWNALRPIVGDEEFYARAEAVSQRALALAAQLPFARPAVQLNGDDVATIRSVLAFHRAKLLPEMLVEIAVIRGLMDGPEYAAENYYSLTNPGRRPPNA